MSTGIQALLAGCIDYAGYFPPARLSLEQAAASYVQYLGEPERWMLGALVCPATRVREAEGLLADFSLPERPLRFTIIGHPANGGESFLAALDRDVETVAALRQGGSGLIQVASLELRLPPAGGHAADPQGIDGQLDAVAARLERAGLADLVCFCEPTPGASWKDTFAALLAGLAARGQRSPRLACKVRCGGPDASTFPSVEQVAWLIHQARVRGVPFKATAGLHHPLRDFDRELEAPRHGFVNLLTATVLAHAHSLGEEEIGTVLADEDPDHWILDSGGLGWRSLRASHDQIATARREGMTSFGSCSFDEPRDDLTTLGWL